jgi:hypothetical protein
MFLFGYWWMEREKKRIGSKERFFLATGGWNENKNASERGGRGERLN